MLHDRPNDTCDAGGGIEEVCGEAEPEVVPAGPCATPS